MRVILLRHAPAESRDPERWPDDADRPLTSRGARRARRAAQGVAWLERRIDRVITSPATRARETAAALVDVLGEEVPLETHDAIGLSGSWRGMLSALAELHDADPSSSVVCVGHEPDLGKLAGVLLFGAPTAMPMKKGGACAIQLDPVTAGAGELVWWCPPRALRALARRRRTS